MSHWRLNNIDHRLVLRLAIPGAFGALDRRARPSNVNGDDIRPLLAILLMLVGIRILFRFSQALPESRDAAADAAASRRRPSSTRRGVEVAATAGGVTNGLVGAWGPVVTPFLLHRGLPPRYAIGSVNTAEVAVAIVSAGTLITSLGRGGLELGIVLAMLIGGVRRRAARRLRRALRPRRACSGSRSPGCCCSPRAASSRPRTTSPAAAGSST